MLLVEKLENRWMQLALSLGADRKAAQDAFVDLEFAYDAPSRMYHSFSHIDACLLNADKHVPQRKEITSYVEMAVFWHDFVYIPGRNDNEERSAFEFQKYGRRMGLDERFIADVADMIPYTKHNANLQGMADRYLYLLDVDLSILGKSEAIFDAYETGIRFEYSIVPEDVFRAGRARVLSSFLARPFIYETPKFRELFELKARENLVRSVRKLST